MMYTDAVTFWVTMARQEWSGVRRWGGAGRGIGEDPGDGGDAETETNGCVGGGRAQHAQGSSCYGVLYKKGDIWGDWKR